MTNEIDWRIRENQGCCLAGIQEGVEVLRKEAAQLDEPTYASLVGLLQAAHHSCLNLQAGWRELDLPLLAWAARNSAETMIWTKFVTSSESNARRFYLDWLNDADEALTRAIELDRAEGTDLRGKYLDSDFDPTAPAKAQAHIAELRLKYQSPSQRRLNLAKVAKEIGEDAVFVNLNPILSKLLHTTAYSVLSFPSGPARAGQALFILDRGFWTLIRVVGVIDAFLRRRNLTSILK